MFFNILILHFFIIQKLKKFYLYQEFLYGTAYQIRLKIALPSLHLKNKLNDKIGMPKRCDWDAS